MDLMKTITLYFIYIYIYHTLYNIWEIKFYIPDFPFKTSLLISLWYSLCNNKSTAEIPISVAI